MAVPFQFTVDLNAVMRKLASIVNDATHYDQSFRQAALRLKQEIGEAEFLVGVANRRLLGSQLGELHREAILITFDSLKTSHDELTKLIAHNDLSTGNASHPAEGQRLSIRAFANPAARRIRWALCRRSEADRILGDIKQSNGYLHRSLAALELEGSRDPQQTTDALETASPSTSRAGLTTQRTRLSIRRGRIPLDRDMLRHSSFLDKSGASLLGEDGNVCTAIYAGDCPVLVESYLADYFDEDSEKKTIELAMLLAQPRVTDFNVLRCEGLVQDPANNTYDFIFDIAGVLADLKDDNVPFTGTRGSVAEHFRSLNFHLVRQSDRSRDSDSIRSQKIGTNGLTQLFRYSKMGSDISHQPVTLLERLIFVRSLAETLTTLHLADWVHGNITSRNVLFFQDLKRNDDSPESEAPAARSRTRLGRPYLFGFQYSRLSDDYSNQRARSQLGERDNAYRHPERQVHRDRGPAKRHQPVHDIYSLGVIFLEIGLGQTAEDMLKTSRRSQQHKEAAAGANPGGANDLDSLTSAQAVTSSSSRIKLNSRVNNQAVFLQLAAHLLPERMGDAYAEATRLCLSGDVMARRKAGTEAEAGMEMTLSLAFWTGVVQPLDRLIEAMAVV